MKKLLALLLIVIPATLQAQNIGIRVDGGLGGAFSFGSFKSYGISAFTEPKVLIGNQIAAGLRLEGDVLIGGTISDVAEEVKVGMSTRAAILLKGEYYITEKKVRPFVGLGLGRYTVANTSASGAGAASITAGNHFGFAPEIGLTLGNFRISGIYHILTGEDLLTLSSGATDAISMNYIVLQIGFKIFGFDL